MPLSETQVFREIKPDKMSHSYNIEHPNALDLKGYLATVTVYPLSEDPNKCMVEWKGSWESANDAGAKAGFGPDAKMGAGIGKNLKYAIDVLTGKREPRPEHAAAMPVMGKSKL